MSLRSGMTRGVITRVSSRGLYVKLPTLYGNRDELGPLDYIAPKSTHDHPDAGTSTSTAEVFSEGDRVLVAAVDHGDWVVLGRLETS